MSQIDDIRKRHGIGETLAACSWEDDEESGMCRWYQHDVGILLNEVDRLQRKSDAAVGDIERTCDTCKYNKMRIERCYRCTGDYDNWHHDETNWAWRGPKEQEGEDG